MSACIRNKANGRKQSNFYRNKPKKTNSDISLKVDFSDTSSISSCVIRINKQKYRVVIGRGSSVSLMSKITNDNFKVKPKMDQVHKTRIEATCKEPHPLRQVVLSFTINGLPLSQICLETQGLHRDIILDRDWFDEYGIKIYFD